MASGWHSTLSQLRGSTVKEFGRIISPLDSKTRQPAREAGYTTQRVTTLCLDYKYKFNGNSI